jgi:hypothetical protein
VIKTTVYLKDATKRRLAALAKQRGVSEAHLVREGVERLVESEPPRPRLPLFSSGKPGLWEKTDEELLKGFGER